MHKSLPAIALIGTILLSGCTSFELLTQFSKERPALSTSMPQAQNGARYKIGLPYRIKGITYYPKVDYQYEEIGMASWYGDYFHGRETANGAIFDMHSVSAAHKTLPLPSIVEVENLSNGRKLIVKVNDRGPFHGNRIIDLSMRAAELLGFKNKGVTNVKVRILAEESRRLAAQMQNKKVSKVKKGDVTLTRISDGTKDKPAEVITAPLRQLDGTENSANLLQPPRKGIYVQVAAFSRYETALTLRKRISEYTSTVGLSPNLDDGGTSIYKVLVGPFPDSSAASNARRRLRSDSFPGAHLITWR